MLQHLAIVGFPFFQASFRRKELNRFRIVLVIIGIPDMIKLATMLHTEISIDLAHMYKSVGHSVLLQVLFLV